MKDENTVSIESLIDELQASLDRITKLWSDYETAKDLELTNNSDLTSKIIAGLKNGGEVKRLGRVWSVSYGQLFVSPAHKPDTSNDHA